MSHYACAADHVYRDPDVMARMGSIYDSYDRDAPAVIVGEYAARNLPSDPHLVNDNVKQSLRAALAEVWQKTVLWR